MRQIDSDPKLKDVAGLQGVFGCYMRNRPRDALEKNETVDVKNLATQAVDYGAPELAESAAAFLESQFGMKAGEIAEAKGVVGPIQWGAPDEPGHGILRWDGADWDMWDYKDRLTLASDLAAQLRGLTEAYEDPLVELR